MNSVGKVVVECVIETEAEHHSAVHRRVARQHVGIILPKMGGQRLAQMLFDHASRVFVVAQSDKLRVP